MKVFKTISTVLQYLIAAFLALMTLAAFTGSVASGIVMLLATLLACPFTRNAGIKFFKDKFPANKIKGWMYAVAVVILFFTSIFASPTVETTDNNQIAQTGADTIETEMFSEENIESVEESISASIEASVEAQFEQAEVEENTIESVVVPEESVAPVETTEPTTQVLPSEEVIVAEPTTSDMEVHYIDVGQGDATLIKSDGQYMLIDAGDNSKGTTVQLYLQKQGVEKLDYLVLTHTDSDHIGGADVIITKFNVDTVFMGGVKKDNKANEELINALEYKRLEYSTPEVGSEYELGDASFTIVAPNDTYSEPNNSGIALVLKNGDNTFLFTGDCEQEAEADILSNGLNIDCDVYQVGHHGSNVASSQPFLDAVSPTYGVISCAEGNSYGHPHAETLNNLRAMGVQVFRTDEQGSIIAYSDGTEITWNCAPSDTWKAGEIVVETTPEPTPTPAVTPTSESATEASSEEKGDYAVNGKNGKIHAVGECPATGDGKSAMKNPVYFNTYEEAEAYSISIAPGEDKRKCGNCW